MWRNPYRPFPYVCFIRACTRCTYTDTSRYDCAYGSTYIYGFFRLKGDDDLFLVHSGVPGNCWKKSIALLFFILTRSSDMQPYLTGPGKGLWRAYPCLLQAATLCEKAKGGLPPVWVAQTHRVEVCYFNSWSYLNSCCKNRGSWGVFSCEILYNDVKRNRLYVHVY